MKQQSLSLNLHLMARHMWLMMSFSLKLIFLFTRSQLRYGSGMLPISFDLTTNLMGKLYTAVIM